MLLVALIWGINFSVTKGAFHRFPPLAFTGGAVRDRQSASWSRWCIGWREWSRCRAGR